MRENPQVGHSHGVSEEEGEGGSRLQMMSAPPSAELQPAAPQWPEVLGSEEGGWGRAAREPSPGWTGIFIAPVFLDLSPPGFMWSVACSGNQERVWGWGRGRISCCKG